MQYYKLKKHIHFIEIFIVSITLRVVYVRHKTSHRRKSRVNRGTRPQNTSYYQEKINLGLRVWVKCGFSSAEHPHFTYLKSAHPQIRILPPAVTVRVTFWMHQVVKYDFTAHLTGIADRSVHDISVL